MFHTPLCGVLGREPQGYDDGDPPCEMEDKDYALDERKVIGEKYVEDGDVNSDAHCEHCVVPALIDICFGVVEDDQDLG